MPKTKLQGLVFTLIMVFAMVYCMTVYVSVLKSGEISGMIFYMALKEMWLEYVIVFVLVFFVVSRLAGMFALRIVTPGNNRPICMILAIQCISVCMIVPSITLIASILHNGLGQNFFVGWAVLAAVCFPAALCLQLFLIGPAVRFLFKRLMAVHGIVMSRFMATDNST